MCRRDPGVDFGYQKRLGSSEWHQLFKGTNDPRLSLTWRERFGNIDSKGVEIFNFYSQGEDVLAAHLGAPGLFEAAGDALLRDALHSWALQEKWKGRAPVSGFGGTTRMGWGFNLSEGGYYTTIGGQTNPVISQIANGFTDLQLIARPFFKRSLVGEVGGQLFENIVTAAYVGQYRDELLAKNIPALTLPMGGVEGKAIFDYTFLSENNVIDMNARINFWPRLTKEWRHSDIKKVSFPYVFSVFEKL